MFIMHATERSQYVQVSQPVRLHVRHTGCEMDRVYPCSNAQGTVGTLYRSRTWYNYNAQETIRGTGHEITHACVSL
eukprot:COSAG06_NODE_5721_length_3306_cov_2.541940_3_plen_76_part_00